MLTKVKAYTSLADATTLELDPDGSIFTDYLRIRNITGLQPVKASINTAPLPALVGGAFLGSTLPTRNIVITIHPNPDWVTWTVESLKKLCYQYFQPGSLVQLVFEDSTSASVTIFGYVESCEPNPFAKDLEIPVSIICPNPYFVSLDPVVVTGRTTSTYDPVTVTYNGDTPVGVIVEVDFHAGEDVATSVQIQTQDPALGIFTVDVDIADHQHLLVSSVGGNKYVDAIRDDTGVVVSRMAYLNTDRVWPLLKPGDTPFSVITNAGLHDWKLSYYEYHGGL